MSMLLSQVMGAIRRVDLRERPEPGDVKIIRPMLADLEGELVKDDQIRFAEARKFIRGAGSNAACPSGTPNDALGRCFIPRIKVFKEKKGYGTSVVSVGGGGANANYSHPGHRRQQD